MVELKNEVSTAEKKKRSIADKSLQCSVRNNKA